MSNKIFSFTNRDYENSRKEGLSKIPGLTNNQWTDLNAGDPGVVLLDYVHALVDMCNFYLDHQATESFLATAKERSNLFKLAKQVSYKVRSAKGALVDLKVMIRDEEDRFKETDSITLLSGTVFETSTGIRYRTLETVVMTDANIMYTVPCQQGEVVSEIYTGTGVSEFSTDLDSGEDAVNQSYTLQSPYPDINTVEILGNDGIVWKNVPYILLEDVGMTAFETVLSPEGRVTVRFGNGNHGRIPTIADVLTITYVSTRGSEGTIAPYDINQTIKFKSSSSGESFVVSVYNDTASTGGSSGESDEDLRRNALAYAKTQGRAVTREDFETLAMSVDGVSSVTVYDVKNAPDICGYHEVKVLVLPDDTVSENSALVRTVKNYLTDKMIPPTNLYVITPMYETVNLTIVASKIATSLVEDNVESDMRDIVQDYFESLTIGQTYNSYDLISRLYSVNGLKSITSITPTSTEISKISKLILGDLTITFK